MMNFVLFHCAQRLPDAALVRSESAGCQLSQLGTMSTTKGAVLPWGSRNHVEPTVGP
jgi:hypothetical protein